MIELADVLSELRAELERARLAAEGAELRFGLGPTGVGCPATATTSHAPWALLQRA